MTENGLFDVTGDLRHRFCGMKTTIVFSRYEDIPRYMVAADLFVLPSVSEALGTVIL